VRRPSSKPSGPRINRRRSSEWPRLAAGKSEMCRPRQPDGQDRELGLLVVDLSLNETTLQTVLSGQL
jgi:hypothetical protein